MSYSEPDQLKQSIVQNISILARLEQEIKHKLKKNQNDIEILWRFGEILRNQGKLEEARSIYSKVLSLVPEYKNSKFIFEVLLNNSPKKETLNNFPQPAPFLKFSQFFPEKTCENIFEFVVQNEDVQVPKKVGSHGIETPSIRSSKGFKTKMEESLKQIFQTALNRYLPRLETEMAFEPLRKDEFEIDIVVHKDGDFYMVHNDCGNPRVNMRKVTFVYYFHRHPKSYEGGDLLLFDEVSNVLTNQGSFTRIIPENNCLIFFPSHYFHQVTRVHSRSGEFTDSRFAINGWIHSE